jgi:succinate dehydrogenase / fumarate reductase cytochrome b subunit
VGAYVVAMAFLGLHLYHGVWSMFQTLGIDTPRWNGTIRTAAKVVSIALFVGFSTVPVAIAAGWMPPPVATPGPVGH